jgi:hypothetical protein
MTLWHVLLLNVCYQWHNWMKRGAKNANITWYGAICCSNSKRSYRQSEPEKFRRVYAHRREKRRSCPQLEETSDDRHKILPFSVAVSPSLRMYSLVSCYHFFCYPSNRVDADTTNPERNSQSVCSRNCRALFSFALFLHFLLTLREIKNRNQASMRRSGKEREDIETKVQREREDEL